MRRGFPVRVSLAAVGIAKGEMHAGKLFVLEQHADHFGQSKIRSEGQLSDAVAVFVGVAILPELLLQVLALAGCVDRKSTRLNSSHPSISYAVFCLKKKK